MSRVIVKGLPLYYSEGKLRKLFSEDGTVTDVKLIRKRNGISRRFAFIGFKSPDDATKAIKCRNGTFIDTSKIEVELAKTMKDPELPMSWREKRKLQRQQEKRMEKDLKRMEDLEKSVRLRKKQKRESNKDILEEKIKANPELQEYLETTKSNGRSWNNDDVEPAKVPSSSALKEVLDKKENDKKAHDDDSMDVDENASESDKEDKEESKENSEEEPESNDESNNKENDETNDNDEKLDDLEWFKSKRVRIPEKHGGEEENKPEKPKEELPEKKPKVKAPTAVVEPKLTEEEQNEQLIEKTGRLFLRNIPYTATEADFHQLFEKYGDLKEVHVAVDSRTGSSKGFAYIQFKAHTDAIPAYRDLDGTIFEGRLLHIIPGKVKKDEGKINEFILKNMPLKKQRFIRRKLGAAKQQFSWNSLYMNNEAVLDSVASEMGISKSNLIDPENSSSAIKQALAEAHVIGDVRKYFEGKGIDLTKFNGKEKDDKIILVKNFQHGVTKEEIGEKFAQYGKLRRIVMPPAGTIAIVEFRDAPNGRTAFNKLSFKRLGKSILYLEKGPKDLFNKEPDEEDTLEEGEPITKKEAVTETVESEPEEEEFEGPTVSIFVKNLNFSTTSSELADTFKPLEGFVVAVVKTKPDARHPGRTLSMGFGFVEFKTKSQALTAIKTMDGFLLSGHKLELKLSTRSGNKGKSSKHSKSAHSPKIIVKNLPFEATRKDVFELFASFGHLKSVRVPKKFDKSARGFAFVEFNTVKEAQSVMDQLQGVHLLGRRLVLDFAEKDTTNAEEEIERMTKKARKQVNAREMADVRETNNRKRELDLDTDEE